MIGETLGRYQLVERLGAGGMGVVYRALDPRLERDVAIKVLNEESVSDEKALLRFRQEARALSRLLHPNIATLFDVDSDRGVEFLVLEFVAGETLARTMADGPLPEARVKAIALDIADALELAHEQGVVHRDLKPGNIIITPRGRAKVLDFGLARILADPGNLTRLTSVGDLGAIIGTVHYMAPEQVTGGVIDARTDIYALGVVLYELLAAAWPHPGGEIPAMLFQIVQQAPRPIQERCPGVSAELCATVMRCLEKEPGRRFSSVRALARALRGDPSGDGLVSTGPGGGAPITTAQARAATMGDVPSSTSGSGKIRSVAVLPLENRSGDPDQEFFADGMFDALITNLAQIGALRVISRTSAMRFKGTRKSMAEIARELQVDAVVEGSVMRSGDRVRISAQLVDVASDSSLWANSYDRDIVDILSLQSDVARAIAEGIRVQVTAEEEKKFVNKAQVNPEAHVAYLRGRFLWNRWDTASLKESINFYNAALAADARYALGWAGLADSYSILGNTNAMPPAEAYPKARQAAERGLALDDNVAELHCSLAYVYRFYVWDWRSAEREFLRALQLNPGYATSRRWYAQFLSGMARHDEAVAEAERALEIDPLSLIIHAGVGDVFFYARRYERAISYYRKSLEMDPTFGPARTNLARALDQMGRPAEALEEFLKGAPHQEGTPLPSPGLAIFLARAGRGEDGGGDDGRRARPRVEGVRLPVRHRVVLRRLGRARARLRVARDGVRAARRSARLAEGPPALRRTCGRSRRCARCSRSCSSTRERRRPRGSLKHGRPSQPAPPRGDRRARPHAAGIPRARGVRRCG